LLAPAIGFFCRLLHRALLAVVLGRDRARLATTAERDPPATRLLGLGQRDRQHAILEVGRAGLLVDVRGESEPPLERTVAAFRIAALLIFAAALLLAAQSQNAVLDRE